MNDVAQSIVDRLSLMGCVVEPCGSRVTCSPPPTNTDQDFLVEITGNESVVARVVDMMGEEGFRWEGSEHYQNVAKNDFMSWRFGDINLIVTAKKPFARRHRLATKLCTRFNLMDKQDRIALFQAILYEAGWDDRLKLVDPTQQDDIPS